MTHPVPRILLALGLLSLLLGCGSAPKTTTAEPAAPTPASDSAVCNPPTCRLPQATPPGDLDPASVPMFVALGFDDNGIVGDKTPGAEEAMSWALAMFGARKNPDGTPTAATFYLTTSYGAGGETGYGDGDAQANPAVIRMWRDLHAAGHEIGNHTHTHPHGTEMTVAQWRSEMQRADAVLTGAADSEDALAVGLDTNQPVGFRTPFLEYNDNTFTAVRQEGLAYDCSIEEGYQSDQDGSNFLWPYTLDEGSPGHDVQVSWGSRAPLTRHPGLYEMPVYVFIAPPDELCEQYGVPQGLRDRLKQRQDYLDAADGKITGFDYNLWALFQMSGDEVLATLKYTFDMRMKGNRAPFLLGMHSDMYAAEYAEPLAATPQERRAAIEKFLDYALSHPQVRVVPVRDVLDWIKSPAPL
ncbi:MAG: polysaccharide deacetylase family protein [Proteobacteria bacterium]|nr:polysaccharide deacetylase family protein [Pseudomonadota bacterium]